MFHVTCFLWCRRRASPTQPRGLVFTIWTAIPLRNASEKQLIIVAEKSEFKWHKPITPVQYTVTKYVRKNITRNSHQKAVTLQVNKPNSLGLDDRVCIGLWLACHLSPVIVFLGDFTFIMRLAVARHITWSYGGLVLGFTVRSKFF